MDDLEEALTNAIKDMDIPLARTLIVDNDVEPRGVCEKDMLLFMRNAVSSKDKPLLRRLLKYDNQLSGKVLWSFLDDIELATMLVQNGANLNVPRGDSSRYSFLHVLSASNDPSKLQLAEFMIDHGANISAVDHRGHSVLRCAIKAGAPQGFLRKLIWNSVAFFANNAVVIANSDRSEELMPLIISLIAADAVDGPTKSKMAQSAIARLIPLLIPFKNLSLPHEEMIKALVVYLGPTDKLDFGSIIGELVLKLRYDLAKLFLERGADPNRETSEGYLPLYIASTLVSSSFTTLLVKYGADVHRCDWQSRYPIHGACEKNSVSNMFLLIRVGADINVFDCKGNTSLTVLFGKIVSDRFCNMVPPIRVRQGRVNGIREEFLISRWMKFFFHENLSFSFLIRQLALAAFKGSKISVSDEILIKKYPPMQKLYDSNLQELSRMQKMETDKGTPYYTFLIANVERTYIFTRRDDCKDVFENPTKLKKLFPYYFCDLRNAYVFARERENILIVKAEFLHNVVLERYQILLPYEIIYKILNYEQSNVGKLNNLMLDDYSHMFSYENYEIWKM